MLLVELTLPGCKGVFSVTYFSTKTSKLSLFKFNFSRSFIQVAVCRSRRLRVWADCWGGRLWTASSLSSSSSSSSGWIPDSLCEGCEERSEAGLEDEAKQPESLGNLWRSNFLLLLLFESSSKSMSSMFFSVSVSSLSSRLLLSAAVVFAAEKKTNLGKGAELSFYFWKLTRVVLHEFNGSHDFGTLSGLRDAQVVQFWLVQVVEVFQFFIAIEHENGEMFLKRSEILTYFHLKIRQENVCFDACQIQ